MPHAYTEDQLVEQSAIGLFAELGWTTVSALEETFGATSTLLRETKGEVVLVSRLRAALARLNPALPPESMTAARISATIPVSPGGETACFSEITFQPCLRACLSGWRLNGVTSRFSKGFLFEQKTSSMSARIRKHVRAAETGPTGYGPLLAELKERVRAALVKAALAVNRELIALYWDMGRAILRRQQAEGWGAKVVERLAADLRAEFPEMTGFSRANLLFMRAFAAAWSETPIVLQPVRPLPGPSRILLPAVGELESEKPSSAGTASAGENSLTSVRESARPKVQQDVAQFPATPPEPVASRPWGHNLLLCKEKNRLTVEYALRDMKKPIGVAEWKTRLVESLPRKLRGALPSVEDLEKGLAGDKP